MIEIKNITKTYQAGDNTVTALNDVSITFRENEFVSILGQSGCGKTTLLNILGGLDKYTSGDLVIDGVSTKDFRDKDWDIYRNHEVGFVFQSYNLIPHLTIIENVELSLTISGIGKKERKEKATTALEKVGLGDQLHKRPNQLSGGQMQRVAIARAIVNNPKIILADEPTGALDSETSVQVMNILKEIAKDRLVIMVTHNRELAEEYSTRIVSLFDGKITNDTKPYNPKKKKEAQKQEKQKSAMSFFTAIYLSFRNLLTKKGRTIITSLAGSIGIIGIALVLAVSNGLTGYINKMQSDTLAGYPISISTVSVDMESIANGMGSIQEREEYPDSTQITVTDIQSLAAFANYNYISPDYIQYIKTYEQQDQKSSNPTLNHIAYSYESKLHVFAKNGTVVQELITDISNSTLTGTTSSNFYEGLNNREFIESQYDVLYGTYPQNKNEVALVISSTNSLSSSLLSGLGFPLNYNDQGQYDKLEFSDIAGENGKTFRVATNDLYYKPVYDENNTIDSFEVNTNINEIYENSSIELKISAILRVKETSPLSVYSNGIVYLPELTQYINQIEQSSLLVTEQRKQATKLFVPYSFNIQELGQVKEFYSIYEMKKFAEVTFGMKLSTEQCIEYALQNAGASTIPTAIRIFSKDFDSKDNIIQYLDAWNQTEQGKLNKISFTDATSMLSSTMGQMVDIVSYVLVAFASISLVVSSIMIGIITYVSVIERTKEIGVLRSIGARKKDISRVFNAETLIIGLTSGIIGVVITFVLTFPISAIIKNLAGGAISTSLAVLDPVAAILLVVISTLLTLISGLIPSRIAAKKDPVKALRTE